MDRRQKNVGAHNQSGSISHPQATRLTWYTDLVLLLTITAVLTTDQLTKYLIQDNLSLGESWPAHGAIRLTHVTNTGSAFGLFPNQTSILVIASVIAIGFLVYFYRTRALSRRLMRFAVGLQLGGAVGNLVDRVFAGAVVDFIDVGWWPVFNLADSSIVVGVVLLITGLIFSDADLDLASRAESSSLSDNSDVGR